VCLRWLLALFDSGVKQWTQVSSQVTIESKNSASSLSYHCKSWVTATKRLSLCSGDRNRGTHLALTLLTFNSLCKLSSPLPTLIPTSCNSSRRVMRRLARISSPIFKTFSGLTKVLGFRAWRSFSTRSRSSRNDFAQLNTPGCDKHSSPNCAWSLVKISEGMTFDNYKLRNTAGFFLFCHLDCTWRLRRRGIRLLRVASLNLS
jgi:hypothetical protein